MANYFHNYSVTANYLAPRENDDDCIKQESGKFNLTTLTEHTIAELETMIKALFNVKYVSIKTVKLDRELA